MFFMIRPLYSPSVIVFVKEMFVATTEMNFITIIAANRGTDTGISDTARIKQRIIILLQVMAPAVLCSLICLARFTLDDNLPSVHITAWKAPRWQPSPAARASSVSSPHLTALLIRQLSSSDSSPHSTAPIIWQLTLLIRQLPSYDSTPYSTAPLIWQLPSSDSSTHLTAALSRQLPHPAALLIRQLPSSDSSPHPTAPLIKQLPSSDSSIHPKALLIRQLPSSVIYPHLTVPSSVSSFMRQLPSSDSSPHSTVPFIKKPPLI